MAVQQRLMMALAPYPDARQAVVTALRELEPPSTALPKVIDGGSNAVA